MKEQIYKKVLMIFLCGFILVSYGYARDKITIKKAVVKIFTVYNNPDYDQPWQMRGQKSTSGSGCIISDHRILTSAHIISNQTFIQVRRFGETKKYVAKVLTVDHECDLALLSVEDLSFFGNVLPVAIAELPDLGDKVKVYGFPIGGEKLSITEGIVSRIEVSRYIHSQRRLLTVQIDAAINPGNSGGPVIKDGKLVGVAFESIHGAENIGYTVPPLIINHFLEDVKDRKYDGFPLLGVRFQKLENDSYRKYLGMNKNQTGVVVTRIIYGSSAWGIIRKGDVVLAIDGIDIADNGTVLFGKRERVDFSYVLSTKYVGDTIKMKILRGKKIKNLSMVLKQKIDIISKCEYDVKPTYYIWGGFIFTNLTYNYLKTWDLNGAPSSLVNHFIYDIRTPERQEVILLQYVLADETNTGYHNYENIVVEKVNGNLVSGMKDLIEKIENIQGKYLEIELENKQKILLDTDKSKNASPEILKRYKIPYEKSENLR